MDRLASRSDGVALRASSTATPSLQNHTFGGKPAHDENRYRVKLRPCAYSQLLRMVGYPQLLS